MKLETYDSSLFIGQSYFVNDASQNFLIFKPISNTFARPAGLTETIVAWQSKVLSNEKTRPPTTSNNSLSPKQKRNYSKIRVKFKGSCLKQDKVTITTRNAITLLIVYELDSWSQDLNADFTLKSCLFRAVKFTKNTDLDKYSYSGYGIGFDSRPPCSGPNFNWGKSVVILGVGNSSQFILIIRKRIC